MDPYLSIVIPIYNEEENIPALWERLAKVMAESFADPARPWEIIFTDDGSQPTTDLELLEQHAGHLGHRARQQDDVIRCVDGMAACAIGRAHVDHLHIQQAVAAQVVARRQQIVKRQAQPPLPGWQPSAPIYRDHEAQRLHQR